MQKDICGLGKYLILFPYDKAVSRQFRGKRAKTEIAAMCVDKPVIAQGISKSFINKQRSVKKKVVSGYNMQFCLFTT